MAAFFCAGGAFSPRSGASAWMFCAGGVFCPRFEGCTWMFCIEGVFCPRFEGCMWIFCAGGVFFHGIRLMHGCFALEGGIGLCREDELHMFLKIIILQRTLK